ncbi:MAG: gamma-glutamyl-phosphate reductase, partial [Paenibacillaceae bacterium]|nr:gamma-glutamyl-phosphate reductase [Paenibacillaceae bacterium]
MTITEIGRQAKEVTGIIGIIGSAKKEEGLKAAAAALLEGEAEILSANQDDVIKATA